MPPAVRSPGPSARHRPTSWTAVSGLTSLVGLVFGLPAVLVAFHLAPPLEEMARWVTHPAVAERHLTAPVSDAELLTLSVSAAWLAWLWLTACVVVEFRAAVSGRPTGRMPVSRHLQSLVGPLVGASLTLLPVGRALPPLRLAAAPAGIERVVPSHNGDLELMSSVRVVSRYDLRPNPLRRDIVTTGDDTSETSGVTTYMVKPGDTLWSIAGDELGSPLRWRQIALLNYGRAQPDGERLTDAHWIYPGWELILPEASSPSPEPPPTPSPVVPTDATSVTVPTSSRPEVPAPPTPVVARGPQRDPVSAVSRDRSVTEPALPTEKRPEPAGLPIRAIPYGVAGAGVVGLLETLRRVQRRYRRGGMRIALPAGDLAVLERKLRCDLDRDGLDVLELGLRAFVVLAIRAGMMPPRISVVRLGVTALEVVVEPAATVPSVPPFRGDAGSASLFLPRDRALLGELRADDEIARGDAPYPALVTIGRDATGEVFIDLEQAGSVDVAGGVDDADGLLGRMAVELATAPRADQVELVLVGFEGELEGVDRVTHVDCVADVMARAQRRVRERQVLLASVGRRANWEIRWTEGGDAWDLCVVLCHRAAAASDPAATAQLVRMAGEGGWGLVVVVGSPLEEARWHLGLTDGRVRLNPGGVSVSAPEPEADEAQLLSGVGDLLRVASDRDGVGVVEPPYDELSDHLVAESLAADAGGWDDGVESGPEIEVRVLGPVEVVGAARPFTRAWAVELVVYLSMHRNGASSEQWATALWPDRIMAPASLHSTASAARRCLGVSRHGVDHLPRAHGRLSLGRTVSTDWARFLTLSERPDMASWAAALELIRGRPFDGLRAPDWVLLEGIMANVEAVVVDLAIRYADLRLAVGDWAGAEWAARQGLQVSAYDERLYRVLLRAADTAGNPAGVESVMAELVHLVADDVEPYDAVHPETLDLYRSLSRRPDSRLRS